MPFYRALEHIRPYHRFTYHLIRSSRVQPSPHRKISFQTRCQRSYSSATNHNEGDLNTDVVTRNPSLASVIREGLNSLHQTSLYIQNSKHTQRPLLSSGSSAVPSSRQLAESHHLLEIAQECLEEVCRKTDALLVANEPIIMMQVHVDASRQRATVYWTLPVSILQSDRTTEEQKDLFHTVLQKKMMSSDTQMAAAVRLWKGKVQARIRHSKAPPVIRLEPGLDLWKPWMMDQFGDDSGDDDEDNDDDVEDDVKDRYNDGEDHGTSSDADSDNERETHDK